MLLCVDRGGRLSVDVDFVRRWPIGGAVSYMGIYTLLTNTHKLTAMHSRT